MLRQALTTSLVWGQSRWLKILRPTVTNTHDLALASRECSLSRVHRYCLSLVSGHQEHLPCHCAHCSNWTKHKDPMSSTMTSVIAYQPWEARPFFSFLTIPPACGTANPSLIPPPLCSKAHVQSEDPIQLLIYFALHLRPHLSNLKIKLIFRWVVVAHAFQSPHLGGRGRQISDFEASLVNKS